MFFFRDSIGILETDFEGIFEAPQPVTIYSVVYKWILEYQKIFNKSGVLFSHEQNPFNKIICLTLLFSITHISKY